jgi:hypothetical protein
MIVQVVSRTIAEPSQPDKGNRFGGAREWGFGARGRSRERIVKRIEYVETRSSWTLVLWPERLDHGFVRRQVGPLDQIDAIGDGRKDS